MGKICNVNASIMEQKPSALAISEFLNEPLPSKHLRKKRKVFDVDEIENISVESSDSNDDGSDANSLGKATGTVSKK